MKPAQRQTAEGILFTDAYQLSLAHLYYRVGLRGKQAQFDHFFREYPSYRYAIVPCLKLENLANGS